MKPVFIGPIGSAAVVWASTAMAQTARDIRGSAAVVPLTSEEPPAKIVVDPPLADSLTHGPNALDVSPRIGHIHVTVDDAPWRWADASAEPLKVLVELVNTNHQTLDKGVVTFVIPDGVATRSDALKR